MEYIGVWVTRDGVKPIFRNIGAITNMNPPTSQKQVRQFIGVVNYCRDICSRSSHALDNLTKQISNKRKFECTKIKQDAFDEIKRIVAYDTLFTYPDFNKIFKIHTNNRKLQLGAFIIHKGKAITLYGIKLTESQKSYKVNEV